MTSLSSDLPGADCLLIQNEALSAPDLLQRIRVNMAARKELPGLPAAVGMAQLAEKRDLLARSIKDLERRIRAYGTVASHKRGWRARLELFLKKAVRKLVLRHVLQQRRIHVRLFAILNQLNQYLEEQDRFLRTAFDLCERLNGREAAGERSPGVMRSRRAG